MRGPGGEAARRRHVDQWRRFEDPSSQVDIRADADAGADARRYAMTSSRRSSRIEDSQPSSRLNRLASTSTPHTTSRRLTPSNVHPRAR